MALSDDEISEAAALYKEHRSIRKCAEIWGVAISTAHNRITRAAQRGLLPTDPVMPGFRISRTAHTYDGDGTLRTQSIQQKPDIGPEFEIPPGQEIKGVSALLDPDGRVIQRWVKTRTESVMPHLVEALKTVFAEYSGRADLIAPPSFTESDLLSVYPIADQHNGLLAWGRETGDSYDLKIGADRLRSSMSRLVAQSPRSSHGLILNLGDWQHTDDQKNMTPRSGNILDVDTRYFNVLTTGIRLMMDCIELSLRQHAHVTVRNLPGNHDPHASIALTVALSAFYSNNPRVTIDDDPSAWFFHRFGQTLIGATHGHKCKPQDMAMAMAVRRREDWGATKFHWFLYGHIHHESAKEVGDVRCESFQTLASNDAHAASCSYSSGKSLTSVTLHREDGEIGRHRVNMAPSFQ